MDCSQILPGAVSPGQCSVATGYYADHPFIVYASGKDVVILDGTLRHLQTILGSSRGYSETTVSCVHCSETTGKIAAVWGNDVVFLQPEPRDELEGLVNDGGGTRVSSDFPGQWTVIDTQVLDFPPKSLSWNRAGSQLLVGGSHLSLWSCDQTSHAPSSPTAKTTDQLSPDHDGSEGVIRVGYGVWKEVWKCEVGRPVIYLKFSPDGTFFASAGENDRLVKIWFRSFPYAGGIGSSQIFSFVYVAHPQAVTGFVWRQTSTHMPRGYVPNVLLTYCKDNICRLWSHSVLSNEHKYCIRFFIAASINPIADIPFRTTLPIDDLPFSVHWLNNKSTAFTNKAEKFHAGALLPISRLGSVQSFASSINEEMLQSWVCIDDREQPGPTNSSPVAGQSSPEGENPLKTHSYSLSNFLSLHRDKHPHLSASRPHPPANPHQDARVSEQKRALAHLMDDWNSSPDLLLCIHPSVGSLMVWTVEGLDAPPNSSRLVHVSFSSCLPHIFPPHLAQSLRQDLLQFIIKEPDAVQSKVASAGGESVTNMSLPVPSIRLPGVGMGTIDGLKDAPRSKSESTLYLVSSHMNGSLNMWSVELTTQSNYCTSIAGLIHCGGTGGHHCKVHSIQRHPWLPIVMTVSSQDKSDGSYHGNDNKGEEEEAGVGRINAAGVVASELIIWNADLPGPLEHKSRLNELSRMLSTDPTAFQHVTWVPPISVGGGDEGVFARCPSSGFFVANIGKELCLFQTSLYCVTKPSPSSFPPGQDKSAPEEVPSSDLSGDLHGHSMTVTSQLGKEGVCKVGIVENDISSFEAIVGVHSFRMCSLVTSFDIKKSLDSKFCKDVVIVLLENKVHDHLKSPSPISRGAKTFIHMWRVTFCMKTSNRIASDAQDIHVSNAEMKPGSYTTAVKKVYSRELPLSSGSHVIHSSPACDVASSLQLQLPTLSSPFLFTTASSDGTIQCWQFSLKSPKEETSMEGEMQLENSKDKDTCECECEEEESFEFELYEVFGVPSSAQSAPGNLTVSSKCLDCCEDETITALQTTSFIPSAISSAYPGRFAMAHQLSKPGTPSKLSGTPSRASIVRHALDQHAVVTIWECESSGGLKWSCEATLFLNGVSGVLASKSDEPPMSVLMDWVPMENGAYLLSTCYASTVSIYGMKLPRGEDEFKTSNTRKGFLPQTNGGTLSRSRAQASWECLVQFPCSQPSLGLTINCFAYTGSNSLVLSIGSEMHLYSCWVREDQLFPLASNQDQALVSKHASQMFHRPTPHSEENLDSDEARLINLLDYAHAVNTPLPQYHPKIMIELMNSGKLKSVKAILVNLVKYLLLYSQKSKAKGNYFEEGGFEAMYESDDIKERRSKRLLSVSSDGILKRSRRIKPKTIVESIPRLSLAKMGILSATKEGLVDVSEEVGRETAGANEEEEYDELFRTETLTETDNFMYGFEEEIKEDVSFSSLESGSVDFSPQLAKKLSSILRYAQLADLSDLEQVRLLAIAETVANTKMSFGDQAPTEDSSSYEASMALDLGTTAGSGYASSGLSHGVRGGEAMDDCGLRYLLALQNYITLSESLPSTVSADKLPPSDFIWAFHSDAETELLSAIPCVQEDKLCWAELRNVGVGWWLRSSDKLKRLIERLAKAQFMESQDPLNALLFYLAMKKQSLVKGLFRTIGDTKMMNFFGNDFQTPRWKKAALKNAFALLGKQRFEQAAAFFLLSGKLWDAVEVCISRLGDLQLAFVTTRLYEGDHGPIYQRLLKEFILGEPSDQTPPSLHLEPSPDPFLRSITCWLLQDYSRALDTLLSQQLLGSEKGGSEQGGSFNPAIFNFYFFLRSNPMLIRRDYGPQSTFHQSQPPSQSRKTTQVGVGVNLSSVGDEPFTPAERNLLFSTAYYHVCHGCPLLALNILSKLPKSCGLGSEVCNVCMSTTVGSNTSLIEGATSNVGSTSKTAESLAGMIQSGTIGDDFGGKKAPQELSSGDDFDWSQPVSSNRFKDEEDDFDWSKPVTSSRYQDDEDDFDWSKPVSAHDIDASSENGLSPPNFGSSTEQEDETDALFLDHKEEVKNKQKSSTLSTQGLFILSLAEQLQYNACLSILTEELITIYIPACCQHLWNTKGKDFLPLLPLPKPGKDNDQSLASHYEANAFEKTILSLRSLLVTWLREETKLVKEICGFEQAVEETNNESEDEAIPNSAPAGYDLLTTLMNYVSLHAATSPSLLTIHVELMHLMNTLLPWSTGIPPSLAQDIEPALPGFTAPNCAVDPSQLPILTSSSLPARHLTNLTLHLRLLSASVVTTLNDHTYPPIATQALPHVDKVFELCCALSSCMTVCLSPTRFTDFTAATGGSGGNAVMSSDMTPSPSGTLADSDQMQQQSSGSPYLSVGRRPGERLTDQTLSQPNTKPSKWPGVLSWPSTLSSDEGKDPTPLSLVLVECLVTVYLGLFSVAWSQHSITDIILLLKNAPSGDMWYDTFGGGVDIKKDEKVQRSMSRSKLLQSVESMTQKFKKLRRSVSVESSSTAAIPDLFVPPQRTLLNCYLTVTTEKKGGPDNEMAYKEGYFVCGADEGEDEDTETEDFEESDEPMVLGKGGPMFRVGSIISESDSTAGSSHNDPNSYAWCLMNLCISKLIYCAVKKVLSTAGVEVLELVTASPLLYSTLKLLEEWESIFTRRLDSLGPTPEDFFGNSEDGEDTLTFQVGPALTRHKFILEPGNSPFSGKSKAARQAKHLWQYLVHRDEVLETFIHYLFKTKVQKPQSPASRSLGSLVEEDDSGSYDRSHEKSYDRLPVSSPECRVVYKEHDSTVTSFCVNSCSRVSSTMLALALNREVLEIEVPDTSLLDSLREGDSMVPGPGGVPQRSQSMQLQKEDFVVVQSATAIPHRMKRPQSSAFLSPRLSLTPFTAPTSTTLTHSQTGQNSSMLMKRNIFGVKRMAPHPTLAYYLTGSIDGSVVMWEFGNPRPVSVQRAPGMGASVTMIRFTPEGNKYGVTDNSGKLSLWQGIHTTARTPYHVLHSGMKHLSDFLFLGSSSFIATCGDGVDNRNVFLWDTLLPTKRSIVKEFVCHEAGVVSLGYSRSKQRLFCGDRRGEVLIFDLKQMALLQSLTVHGSAVSRIIVDDVDGFIATGSADGDIKVLDSSSFEELASYPGEHAKSRLFRQSEGGVTDMGILPGGKLYSCGADGSVKCRTVVL